MLIARRRVLREVAAACKKRSGTASKYDGLLSAVTIVGVAPPSPRVLNFFYCVMPRVWCVGVLLCTFHLSKRLCLLSFACAPPVLLRG